MDEEAIGQTGVCPHHCPPQDRCTWPLGPLVVWLHASCVVARILHVYLPIGNTYCTTVPMLLASIIVQQPIFCQQSHPLVVQM